MTVTSGMLYWITGLSGAGKTSLAHCLYQRMQVKNNSVVVLDGDALRSVYNLPGHYDFNGRKSMAMRHAQMCHLITSQGIDVICPTISMFDEVRQWLVTNIEFYTEIYLSAEPGVLSQRRKDSVGPNEMVGIDVAAELPQNPHIKLTNNGFLSPNELCDQLEFYLSQQHNKRQYL